jgi:hypothetical protein
MHMVQTASNHSSHSSTGTATIVWCLSRCHCSTDHPIMCLSMPFSCLICRLTNKIIDISSQLSLARTTHLMCVCTYMCVYMYVCMYVYIYIYIYIYCLACTHLCFEATREFNSLLRSRAACIYLRPRRKRRECRLCTRC